MIRKYYNGDWWNEEASRREGKKMPSEKRSDGICLGVGLQH
ncbi:hypothetical protein F528_1717 [Neisseria meningitidis 992008]|uniref:Uncharacterized protein n=2 Tax=Neisseria meningitidis TaxID=487 RepID=X5ERM6_NEIME|nr:hypothetical protein NMA510612_1863 [Neisseria meningitidis]KER39336.1 hypothetical protein F528_1717 [Neisseria meningitidis 992008]CBA04848.1 hypothetical protein predicted by Glimmer/Critica [Neisseria meningitidis alpha275]